MDWEQRHLENVDLNKWLEKVTGASDVLVGKGTHIMRWTCMGWIIPAFIDTDEIKKQVSMDGVFELLYWRAENAISELAEAVQHGDRGE